MSKKQKQSPKQVEEPSLISTLRECKLHHERELVNVNAALDTLQKNPEVAKVLEPVVTVT